MIAIAVLASLAFAGWLISLAIRKKPIKAHTVCHGLATVAAIFTYSFFLGMNLPDLLKIILSIILGLVLIFLAASLEQRQKKTQE